MNTIEQNRKQIKAVLGLVGEVGFTDAENIQLVAGRKRRGLPAQMMRDGFLLKREILPNQYVYGLSKKGSVTAGAKQYNLYSLSAGHVQHSVTAQHEVLLAAQQYPVLSYEFEPQRYHKDYRPDARLNFESETVFLEIELTAKSGGELERFFLKCISRKTVVVFKDKVIYERYLDKARDFARLGIPNWKDLEGWVRFDDFVQVSKDEWSRVFFKMHKDPHLLRLSDAAYPVAIFVDGGRLYPNTSSSASLM